MQKNIFWFEMPMEGTVNGDGCVMLGVTPSRTGFVYAPYDQHEGLLPFKLPDFAKKPIGKALDMIEALKLPACVKVEYLDDCDQPDGIVCKNQEPPGSDVRFTGEIRLQVSTDFRDQGTPNETRRLRNFTDKPVAEARAAISKLFTTIEIEETDLPCERGLVCDIEPAVNRFYAKDQKITLKVRRAKR